MVKNLPSVERSTQIRFGKHVPDATEQEDNTIVFNASNVLVPTPYSNAVYLSPIRNKPDFTAPEIVLLMYDRNTKEITESGESANALVGGATLDLVVSRSNNTANTVQFLVKDELNNDTSIVTEGRVGVANFLPQHTLSVGSNLYVNDTSSNVLVVSGNVAILKDLVIDGNLRVNGDTSVIYTENTSIKDALIELGTNNGASDTTLDLGILMHRPDALSNVVIGYREGTDEFALAYTESKPTDKTFTPKLDEDINVHVYGLTHVDANIYAHEDVLVTGNLYVSTNVSITEELTISNNVYADKDLEVMGNAYVDGNVVAYKDFTLTGNAYVSGNVSITEELTVSNNVYADKDLEVMGNVYVDGNVVAYKDFTLTGNAYVTGNVTITEELTISNNVYADKDLEVMGNVYVDGNVVAYKDFTLSGNAYVTGNVSITEELTVSNNVYADKDLEVVGNVYVDGNVVAYKDFTLTGNAYVSGNVNITNQLTVSDNAYVTGNVQVTEALIVSGNTHLEGDNVFITHTMDFLDPKTAIVTNPTSNVGINIGQLKNVNVESAAVEQVIVYDGTNWNNQYIDQTLIRVKNANGGELSKGTVVCTTGHVGNDIFEVVAANASDPARMPAIGVLYQTLAQNGEGVAVSFGRADGLNSGSLDVSNFIEGETLYVSNTVTGGLSNVKPYGPTDLIQNAGILVNKSSGVGFITGIGRANDIPNAPLITDYNDMKYIYVNDINNDMKKIASENLNIPLTTAVSSSSNSAANAVTLRGVSITSGDGFHGDLVVAGNVTVDSTTLHVDAETNRVGLGTTRPGQLLDVRGAANVGVLTATSGTVTDATHSISKDTGVLVVTRGGLGVEANIHSTNVFAASHIAVGTSATSNTFDVRGTANVGALVATSTHISDATESTSTTTGALKVTGGVGIQKDLYARDGHFSTDVSVGSLTNKKIPYANASKILTDSQISQEADGTVVISNDVEISGSLIVSGESFEVSSGQLIVQDRIIDIANNNPDHDLDIGILMEHPGHNIGLIHHPEDYFSMGYTQNGYSDTHILRDYSNEFTLNVWGYVTTQNTVTIEHNDLYVKDGLIGVNTDSPLADLHVVGNAYVTSNLQVGGDADLYVDTARSSVGLGTNAPVATLDVRGNVYMSSNLAVNGTDLYVDTTLNRVGIRTQSPGYNLDVRGTANVGTLTTTSGTVTDATPSSSKDTGVFVLTQGGLGVEANIHSTNVFAVSHIGVGVTDGSTTKALDVRGTANVGAFTTTSVAISDATTSTDQNSGALIVQNGGVGIEENLNVGGTAKIWDATDATTTTSGALQVVGGLGVAKTIFAADMSSGSVDVTDDTTSTSTTTGALTVGGGVGIVENIFVGGTGKIEDATDATTTTSGALQVVGGIGVAKTVFAADLSSGSVDVTDATGSTSTTTGALTVGGGVGIVENLFVGGTGKIEDATDATNTTSGALQVVGGLGVAKTVFAADLSSGSVDVTDTTEATSTTTGALTVAGGISTQTNVHAANVYISGGLITNTAGVTKKTYAYSGDLGTVSTTEATIKINFTNHVFYAKVVAHLAEGTGEDISTLAFECGGGKWDGTTPSNSIVVGPLSIFGVSSANPWDSTVTTTATSVSFKPSETMASAGNYNVFVEYISQSSSGKVSTIEEGTGGAVVTFGY
jgi:cytoskeletal protein CcmA (bactofilin family)